MAGKSRAVDIVAALVERHQGGFFRHGRRDRRGFLSYSGDSVPGAAFGDFMHLEAAKAELAADIVESLAIALGQFPLRSLLQPADTYDCKAHESIFRQRNVRLAAENASTHLSRAPRCARQISMRFRRF